MLLGLLAQKSATLLVVVVLLYSGFPGKASSQKPIHNPSEEVLVDSGTFEQL